MALALPDYTSLCGFGQPRLGQLTEGYGTRSPLFFDLDQIGRTRHKLFRYITALSCAFTAKPPGMEKTRRLCLCAPTICFDRAIVGAVEPEMQETGPTAQSLHPRLIAP